MNGTNLKTSYSVPIIIAGLPESDTSDNSTDSNNATSSDTNETAVFVPVYNVTKEVENRPPPEKPDFAPPKMKIAAINRLGLLTIKFSEQFFIPANFTERINEETFDISIKATNPAM